MKGYFLKDAVDAEPNMVPIEISNRKSKISCASACLACEDCIVFAFKDNICSLYNSYDSGDLVSKVNSTVWV